MLGTALQMFATNYYVSTQGDDQNNGTSLSTAFAGLPKAVSIAHAGDVIFVESGVYAYSSKISLSRNGSEDHPIIIKKIDEGRVVIDFSDMSLSSSNRGFSLSGNYWHIQGLFVQYAGDNGMHISGSYNTVEQCSFFANRDTGLQLGNGASNNRIINCDSYGNADPSDYGDADGFACKMDVGDNNYFYGCRAWLNVDDGWDGYLRGSNNVNTTLESCWTWMNGYFLDGTDGGEKANGNGFKIGGSDDKDLNHNFTLIHCVAFDNKSKGFDQNNNKGNIDFHNCTAYRNKGYNFSIPMALNSGQKGYVANCIAIDGRVKFHNTIVDENNSWNGYSFSMNDFASLDTTGVSGPRQTDGALPELELFRPVAGSVFIDAGIDLSYDYKGSAPDLGAIETSDSLSSDRKLVSTEFQLMSYNNPVTTSLRLQLSAMDAGNVYYQIYNIQGHLVINSHYDVQNGALIIPTESLPTGLYILRFNDTQQHIKFMKSF